jgi:hypothetical protein
VQADRWCRWMCRSGAVVLLGTGSSASPWMSCQKKRGNCDVLVFFRSILWPNSSRMLSMRYLWMAAAVHTHHHPQTQHTRAAGGGGRTAVGREEARSKQANARKTGNQ